MKIPNKIKSRKFLITVASATLLAVFTQIGLTEEASGEIIAALVALVASYNLGQGYADGKAAEAVTASESQE
jgi:hypothetical protein